MVSIQQTEDNITENLNLLLTINFFSNVESKMVSIQQTEDEMTEFINARLISAVGSVPR